MSLVSVIIPAYNGESYIENAIASILQQTYDNYEIIVVDDGSTDRTREVVEQAFLSGNSGRTAPRLWRDRNFYYYQDNQGVAVARNKGLELAKGSYIAFLDQDDFFYPLKLEKQVYLLESNPRVGLVNSGWKIVDREGETISKIEPWHSLPQLSPAALIVWKPVFLGAMLFRRSWLEKTTGFNCQLTQTPDVELVMRLAALGCQGDWTRLVTVGYRQHEDNVSRDTLVQAEELNAMLEKFFTRSDISPEIKALERESRYQSLVWSGWRLYVTGYFTEMSYYLARSFSYSDRYKTETILHWIESFRQYALEYGTTVDVNALCNSPSWQSAIEKYVLSI